MVSMVRPGEGGIYDNAKVFMMRLYRNRVTGGVGKVEDGHMICGLGKKEELGFGHIWLEVPSAHPVDNVVNNLYNNLYFRITQRLTLMLMQVWTLGYRVA